MPHGVPEAAQSRELVSGLCKPIISHLRSHQSAKPFNTPVDAKKYPTYAQLVPKPMDLKTIMRNLDKQRYATIDECHADVDLVWSNCRVFNGDVRAPQSHAPHRLHPVAVAVRPRPQQAAWPALSDSRGEARTDRSLALTICRAAHTAPRCAPPRVRRARG